jgi:nucleoside-diphosphate-sugar epimerase
VLIVISPVFTWANSQRSTTAYTDADFSRRVPFPKFQQAKHIENLAMSANKFHKKLRVHVICSGLIYGNGEANDGFYEFFRRAWISLHPDLAALPVIGDGKNSLPTIHVRDLARFVVALTEESAKKITKQYLIAVDQCKSSTQG